MALSTSSRARVFSIRIEPVSSDVESGALSGLSEIGSLSIILRTVPLLIVRGARSANEPPMTALIADRSMASIKNPMNPAATMAAKHARRVLKKGFMVF